MNKTTIRTIVAIGLILLLFGITSALVLLQAKGSINRPPENDNEKKAMTIVMPVGVMIENELLARPFQTGLSQANIIYEAPTEGGITRFLAVFLPGNMPAKLGPVRSARSYFLDWMHEYKGALAHVGGRYDALARLRREKGIFDADQYAFEDYFWRENVGRAALEHTMFTDGKHLKKLIEDQKWTPSVIPAPPRRGKTSAGIYKHFTTNDNPTANKIFIDFGFPTYRVDYEYDSASNEYLRFQAKKPHIDNATGKQLFAKTVIIQSVNAWSNGDAAGSISMKIIDGGNAVVFSEGRAIKAKWKKESLEAPTEFFDDADGAELNPPSDNLWIEIVPLYNSFSYKDEN